MNYDAMVDALLLEGLVDWFQPSLVAWVATTRGGAKTDDEVRILSIEIIRQLLARGLVVTGDIGEKQFAPWGLGLPETIERIDASWRDLPSGRASLGDVCWFELTDKGEHPARAIEGRQDSSR